MTGATARQAPDLMAFAAATAGASSAGDLLPSPIRDTNDDEALMWAPRRAAGRPVGAGRSRALSDPCI